MNAIAAVLGAATITLGINSRVIDVIIFLLTAAAMIAVAFIKKKGSHRQPRYREKLVYPIVRLSALPR